MTLNNAKTLIEYLPSNARIIEIAGPTLPHNDFLFENSIKLPAKMIITNIQNPVIVNLPPFTTPTEVIIDKIVDVKTMSSDLSSVDMIVCSHLTWYEITKKYEWFVRSAAWIDYKFKNMSSRVNLHISLFRESEKALRKGGLLLVEGLREDDYRIAKKVGFNVVYRSSSLDKFSTALFIK